MKKCYLLLGLFLSLLNTRAQLICDFTTNDTVGCAPFILLCSPNETSSAPIVARRWSVTGPGPANCNFTTPPGLNPGLSFVASCAGNYCITLWSKNSNGDTASITKCNVFVADTPALLYPYVTPSVACSFPFDVKVFPNLIPGAGSIDSFGITWGCGSGIDGGIVLDSATHTYTQFCPASECQQITLFCHSTSGCWGTASLYVCIDSLVADFDILPDSTAAGVYNGYNLSYGNNITSYLWKFGDGDSSTLQYPTHTYAMPGQYYVCLSVNDGICSDTYCDSSYLVFKNESGLMSQLNILNPNVTVGLLSNHNSAFSISPNPATTTVTISIPENLIGKTALVTDITGKQMAAVQLQTVNQQLSTNSWSSGVYLVRVGNAVSKLVVQK